MNQTIFENYKNKDSIKDVVDLNNHIHQRSIDYNGVQLTFVEVVWYEILEQLRAFGISKENLKKLEVQLLTPFDLNQILNIEDLELNTSTQEYLNQLINTNSVKVENEIKIDSDKSINGVINPITHISILAYNIMEFIITRSHITFLIDKNWLVYAWNESLFQNYVDAGIDIKFKHHISLSLPEVMKEFILKDNWVNNYPQLGIISNDESEVLKLLKLNKIKTLTIRVKNKKIKLIEATEIYNSVDKASRFMDHILKGKYQDISFSTQAGNITHFEKTTKYKL